MSIIVDANATHKLFGDDPGGRLVYEKIREGSLVYVTGGQHKSEILRGGMKKEVYRQLQLSGMLRVYPDEQCSVEAVAHLELRSDDPHIISLAIRSNCRLLFSHDVALCQDFKDKKIIDNPRGKVYKDQRNARLLKKSKLAK